MALELHWIDLRNGDKIPDEITLESAGAVETIGANKVRLYYLKETEE